MLPGMYAALVLPVVGILAALRSLARPEQGKDGSPGIANRLSRLARLAAEVGVPFPASCAHLPSHLPWAPSPWEE